MNFVSITTTTKRNLTTVFPTEFSKVVVCSLIRGFYVDLSDSELWQSTVVTSLVFGWHGNCVVQRVLRLCGMRDA
eukprot:m.70142 g.70142  ORF g.70142 m.70142 type:complete len:75 (-) comp16051_c0_seq4:6497-6721(-)